MQTKRIKFNPKTVKKLINRAKILNGQQVAALDHEGDISCFSNCCNCCEGCICDCIPTTPGSFYVQINNVVFTTATPHCDDLSITDANPIFEIDAETWDGESNDFIRWDNGVDPPIDCGITLQILCLTAEETETECEILFAFDVRTPPCYASSLLCDMPACGFFQSELDWDCVPFKIRTTPGGCVSDCDTPPKCCCWGFDDLSVSTTLAGL